MRQPTFFMVFDYDYTGNPALLDRRKVAFFASRVVSPAVEEQALRWAEACCATDRVVISGFQSPLEKSVFELLLKARHPVDLGPRARPLPPLPSRRRRGPGRAAHPDLCRPQRPPDRLADRPNPQLHHRHDGRRERLRPPHGRPPQLARCPLWAGAGAQTGALFPAINVSFHGKIGTETASKPALNDRKSAELNAEKGQIPQLFMTQNVGLEVLNWLN